MKKRGLGAPLPEGIRAKTRFRTLSARGNPFGHVEKRGHSAFVRLDGSIFETEKTLRKPMHRGLPCWRSLGKNAASFNLICLKTNRVQQAVTECTLELSGCILLKKWSLRVQTFPVRAGSWSQDLGLSGRCGASEFGPLQRNKTSPEPETSSISVKGSSTKKHSTGSKLSRHVSHRTIEEKHERSHLPRCFWMFVLIVAKPLEHAASFASTDQEGAKIR